jgi:hypothetical protein
VGCAGFSEQRLQRKTGATAGECPGNPPDYDRLSTNLRPHNGKAGRILQPGGGFSFRTGRIRASHSPWDNLPHA